MGEILLRAIPGLVLSVSVVINRDFKIQQRDGALRSRRWILKSLMTFIRIKLSCLTSNVERHIF